MNEARLNNDAPIVEPGQDRLGFGELARHLANVFLHNDLSGGLVVGVEGEWGSGKSSLANLALRKLKNKSNKHRLRIVRFSPWIIGHRDELLGQLFAELDSALSDLLPIKRRKHFRTALRKYMQASPFLAASLKLAGDVGIPTAGAAGRALDSAASTASDLATPSLRKLNDELRADLIGLDGKVVVFVDDIDRLEPAEAVEVLRLIRAVADFPNVGYLLAYDPDNLAKCLRNAIRVNDGHAYIEKIVQASFAIPEPMGFDLRSWLSEETSAIFDRTNLTPEADERLERALSCWCSEYISTPRDVARIANALKLHIAPLADRLDPADGLFIQIIRLHHPELYNWVQRYLLRRFGSDSEDAYLAWRDANHDRDGEQQSELARIVGKQGETLSQLLGDLRQHLPQASIPDNHPVPDFGAEERQQFAAERRLNSPSYFRLYFALSLPAGFLSDEGVSAFLDMCSRDREAAFRQFRDHCAEERPQGGNMAQVLLSRILERKGDIPADRIPDLFAVLGDSMDTFARWLPERDGSPPWLYGDALEIFRLIQRLGTQERMRTLEKLFAGQASLAWLNSIVREAIIAHGFAGHQASPVEQRLLTEEEFKCIRGQFLKRLEQADATKLKETPYFLSLLYGWHQAGDDEKVLAWVRKQSSNDADLIDLLKHMMSKSSMSDGNGTRDNYYLAEQTLKKFFGSERAVTERLIAVSSDATQTDDFRAKAKELLQAVEHLDLSKLERLQEMRERSKTQPIP